MQNQKPSNYTRPNMIIKPHRDDTNIASIILYEKSKTKEKGKSNKDFLSQLTDKVLVPVIKAAGGNTKSSIPVLTDLNADGSYHGVFNNFIVTGVSENYSTIQKIHLNFSNSWNVFFFSDNPVVLGMTGGFVDTEEFPYYQEFMMAYEKYLSGPQMTRRNMGMIISYDGKIIDGYLTKVSVSTDAMSQGFKQFQIGVLVKSITWDRNNLVRDRNDANVLLDSNGKLNVISNEGRLRADNSIETKIEG